MNDPATGRRDTRRTRFASSKAVRPTGESKWPPIHVERASPSFDELTINTIRTLTLDAVEKAASGHPGTPMGMAPVGYVLWSRFLRYDPDRPDWPNRDRFVLSVGHASLLLYSLLHLSGVREIDANGRHTGQPAVSLDDLRQFRQLDFKTPAIPNIASPPASKRPPARSVRVAGIRSEWRSRNAGSPSISIATAPRCSTTTSTPCAATAT